MTDLNGVSFAATTSNARIRSYDATGTDGVSRHPVLIFSADPLAAALLAAAIELAGHAPHFAQREEPPRDALRRVRPKLVLIDCDHEESCSDEFVGPALMMQARVLLFRSKRTVRDASDFSQRLNLRVMELPLSYDDLFGILSEMLAD